MSEETKPEFLGSCVLLDEVGWRCAELFNPNYWAGDSRALMNSCWAEYSVLDHNVNRLAEMCKSAVDQCREHIETLKQQWAGKKLDLERGAIFGLKPDLHLRIEAFLSEVKTLLDLMVQLLYSEHVVTQEVHGFHKKNHRDFDPCGGNVLNILEHNVSNDMKNVAFEFYKLIKSHKTKWIDGAISARDQLIHPLKGMYQLMYRMHFEEKDGALNCSSVDPPTIDGMSIDKYARQTLSEIHDFATDFINLLKRAKAICSPDPGK